MTSSGARPRRPARAEAVPALAAREALARDADVARDRRRQRPARRDDRLERLAGARAPRDPVHDLGGVAGRRARRPGVRLAVQADDVGGPLAQQLRRPRPPRVARAVDGVALARAAHRLRVVKLRVDHRVERAPQRREPIGIALERAQHLRQRLDRRHAVIGRLLPDPVVAGRRRREPDLGQRRQHGVALEQLARLPPGAVDHDQRDRTGGLHLRDVDRARPGEQQIRVAAAGERRAQPARRRRSRRPRAAPIRAGRGAPAARSRSGRAARAGVAAAARASASAARRDARSSRPTRVAGSARRSRGGERPLESRRAEYQFDP